MKEVTIDGVELVELTREEKEKLIADNSSGACHGCYFCTSDVLGMVNGDDLPSKQTRLDTYSCEFPRAHDAEKSGFCFHVPKDYYERHKPKWKL